VRLFEILLDSQAEKEELFQEKLKVYFKNFLQDKDHNDPEINVKQMIENF